MLEYQRTPTFVRLILRLQKEMQVQHDRERKALQELFILYNT